MNYNRFPYVLLLVLSAAIVGCTKKDESVCGSKEIEAELLKKAGLQGMLPSEVASKLKFSILSVEQIQKDKDSSENKNRQNVSCMSRGRLEYIDEVQSKFKEIRNNVKQAYDFVNIDYSKMMAETKIITFAVKKNELTGGILLDGDWMDTDDDGKETTAKATPLFDGILEIIEKKEMLLKHFEEVAQIYRFRNFIVDARANVPKSGKAVKNYILDNKIPVLSCILMPSDKFECRIANDRAALNIALVYEDSNALAENVFDGKRPTRSTIIRDEKIGDLIDTASYVQYKADSLQTFNITYFKTISLPSN